MRIEKNLLAGMGRRIRRIRKALGLKQKELAKELKVSGATLCEVESGANKPGFDILFNLFHTFDVNIHYVFGGNGKMFNHLCSGLRIDERFTGEQAVFLEEFLKFFQESEFVRYHMMACFKKCLLENAELIEREKTAAKKKNNKE